MAGTPDLNQASVLQALAFDLGQTTIKAPVRNSRNHGWREASPLARRGRGAGQRVGIVGLAKQRRRRATGCKGAGPLLQQPRTPPEQRRLPRPRTYHKQKRPSHHEQPS